MPMQSMNPSPNRRLRVSGGRHGRDPLESSNECEGAPPTENRTRTPESNVLLSNPKSQIQNSPPPLNRQTNARVHPLLRIGRGPLKATSCSPIQNLKSKIQNSPPPLVSSKDCMGAPPTGTGRGSMTATSWTLTQNPKFFTPLNRQNNTGTPCPSKMPQADPCRLVRVRAGP
jgi:hypothetical protein